MMPPAKPEVRIGCSGWQYASWRGRFYPADLPIAGWLEYYAGQFDTVELNNSFYRLPEKQTFATWARRAPAGFLFAVKASRYLTHLKRLNAPGPPVRRLFSRATALGPRLGPVLYQLPGNFPVNVPRLQHLLRLLPRRHGRRRIRHVMEFRHPSWYCEEVFRLLDQQHVALCVHDRAGSAYGDRFVGPFVYVRFHGASGHYHGGYSDESLDRWAERLGGASRDGRDVFAYFNNDPDAQAPRDAAGLIARLRTAGVWLPKCRTRG
jgi:uncharacterized protein YecE (DUF72 family)